MRREKGMGDGLGMEEGGPVPAGRAQAAQSGRSTTFALALCCFPFSFPFPGPSAIFKMPVKNTCYFCRCPRYWLSAPSCESDPSQHWFVPPPPAGAQKSQEVAFVLCRLGDGQG